MKITPGFHQWISHILKTRLRCFCESCLDGQHMLKISTGMILRELLMEVRRKWEGSDAASIRIGNMSIEMAQNILLTEITSSVQEFLDDFFHEMRVDDHMNVRDLPQFLVPLLKPLMLSSQLQQTLAVVYRSFVDERLPVPDYVKDMYLIFCLFLNGIVSLNPNMSWSLPGHFLASDVIVLRDELSKF